MGLVINGSPASANKAAATMGARATRPPRPGATSKIAAADKEKPKRQRKSAMEVLRLEDPLHALLCAPGHFVDCTQPHEEVADHLISDKSSVFLLRYMGTMRGYNAEKKQIWSIPSERIPQLGALPWPLIKQTRRTDIDLADAKGRTVCLSQFYSPRNWADRQPGEPLLILGKLSRWGSKLSISMEREAPMRALGTVWPQYEGIPGQLVGEKIEILAKACINEESAYRACHAVILGETGLSDEDLMAACGSTATEGFQSAMEVLRALHRPQSVEEGRTALEYARRITALGVQASALRHHVRQPHPKAPLPVAVKDVDQIAAALPMPLTKSQREVALDVVQRLAQPKPLNGLLSGDVGTGKTLTFLLPAVAAHKAGARVAIITPRTLLADQIAQEIFKRFDCLGVEVERVPTGGKIKNPKAILVSTHGLATVAARQDYAPQFLICDEQHKFSADAREALVAPYTHVLEVSATPVPRSLAAALYEGMEIFNLRECPVEKHIFSEVVDMNSRKEVIAGLRHTVNTGGVAAMIYPKVATAEDSEAQSVTRAFESLNAAFPGHCVMLHGEMSDDQMRENIAMLRSGEKRIVVASTVLEIGIDIPSVNFMAVRDADNFGVSQLHQLRGRLVRNGGTGVFMMVVENLETAPQSSLERLEAVASTTDGYKLAEMDLMQRGFGELDGSAQTGNTTTIFRNIKLNVTDFLGRKLKSLRVESGERDYNQAQNLRQPMQERLV